ncbi:MAG: hypothetical protein CVU44_15240 [Chloroflexi bacterium HGW-Chloroflexi-6]|nr:MAG: hypothetical protein CVU44_15240 [Chloroflexi bacterium HGW-Chloroflexi-6]
MFFLIPNLTMSRLFYISLSILSIAAGFALWYATPSGLGLTNDSAAYIGGARSLLAGTGYSDVWLDSDLEAVTHYPPLLSLTLSGIGLLGLDPYRGARVLNVLLIAANTGLIGLLGFRATKSQMAGIFLALLFATNAQLLRIHAQVLSEPLFLFFSLLSFLFFDLGIKDEERKGLSSFIFLAGLCTGLAFLTRYSGLALIATFLLAIFLLSHHSRLKRIALFLAGVIPPIAIWFIRNSLVADSATNRVIQFNPIQISNIRVGLFNFSQFISPFPTWQDWLFKSGALSVLLITIGIFLLAWLVYHAWNLLFTREIEKSPNPLTFTTAIYIFGYLCAVLFSMSFFDASTKFQHRILSPLYVSWMILLVAVLQSLNTKDTKGTKEEQEKKSVFIRIIRQIRVPFALTVVAAILALSTFNFQRSLAELHEIDGLGYASWRWRQMNVLAIIEDLPPDVAIYSNSPPAVYLVTGRASRVIPTTINPVSGLPRTGYEQSLAEMREELLAGRAVLALFDTSDIEGAFGEEIALQFDGLTLLEKSQGNVLYGKP